ncbi:Cleavage stimulation factor subunit 2 [Entophlyctis luteolus]|nr:Cleavage stimulation factor subunit 2 [Entophlyctis luteolus]
MSRVVFDDVTETQLIEIFKEVGPVSSFRLVFDKDTGKPKGFGFCTFQDSEIAASAVRNLDGFDIGGRLLRVDFAESDTKDEASNRHEEKPVVPKPVIATGSSVDAISKALETIPSAQLLEAMAQLKLLAHTAPDQVKTILTSNPQLAYAIFQAMVAMNAIDHGVMVRMGLAPPMQQPAVNTDQQAEQQKLLMQVLSMTPEQIQALPLDQRAGVLQLVIEEDCLNLSLVELTISFRSVRSLGYVAGDATSASANGSFRRSIIVCQNTHLQKAPQQHPESASLQTAPPPVQEDLSSCKRALEKAQSRIFSLERTVESLQEQHKGSLQGLHKEIERLQNLCSDLQFADIFQFPLGDEEGASPAVEYFREASPCPEMKAPWFTSSHADTNTDCDAGDQTQRNDPSNADDTKPYHVLLQQQRRKYQTFIDRINADNKRKQSEIDNLRAELELVRDVLAVAGLDVDLVQLRGLVAGRDRARDMVGRARKAGVLPPIGNTSSHDGGSSGGDGDGGAVDLALLDSRAPAGIALDARNFNTHSRFMAAVAAAGGAAVTANADGADGAGDSAAARAERLFRKPRDYHNANLDYHGRAHLYSVPPPAVAPPADAAPTSPLIAPAALSHPANTSASELAPFGIKNDLPTLPPISSQSHQSLQDKSSLLKAEKSTGSWTKRLKGTQILRQKNWKELTK